MSYCVSGAGTPGVDGQYDIDGVHGTYNHVGGTDFRLVYTGYYELRSGANPYVVPVTTDAGYYYDSAGAGGSYVSINTVNTDGSYPIPTIVSGECVSSLSTSSPATLNDIMFLGATGLFFLVFVSCVLGYLSVMLYRKL